MSKLKRYLSERNTYFITIVTTKRIPILINSTDLLFDAIEKTKNKYQGIIDYYVILPEHLHLIYHANENSLSDFVHDFKLSYGANYRKENNLHSGKLWQDRFWDHIIRNQVDLNNHIDYIHYNPVKHGLVKRPFDWEYSSIHNYKDYYQTDWGVEDKIEFSGDYGE